MKFLLTAKRSNGETMFYCVNSNGATMAPNAQSIAHRFDNRHEANAAWDKMEIEWAGLLHWRIEPLGVAEQPWRDPSTGMTNHERAMLASHGICPQD